MDSIESAPKFDQRQVLVINIHGLSPFFLGPYGNEWVHTPTFDRLAARGVVFDNHFAPNLDPAAASRSLFAINAVHVNDGKSREGHSLTILRRKIYQALENAHGPSTFVVNCTALLPPWKPPLKYLNYYFGTKEQNSDAATLLPWSQALPDQLGPDDDRTLERLQDTFAAVMSALDRGLAKLLAGCRVRGWGQNAMIIITSDLAFPLGEQGPVGWGRHGIIEGAAHLPLIIRFPDNEYAGIRVSSLTEPNDLVAMLTAGESSLLPLIRGVRARLRDHLIIRHQSEAAVRTADRLCVIPSAGAPRLYIKPEDRFETLDLASKREDDVLALTSLLT